MCSLLIQKTTVAVLASTGQALARPVRWLGTFIFFRADSLSIGQWGQRMKGDGTDVHRVLGDWKEASWNFSLCLPASCRSAPDQALITSETSPGLSRPLQFLFSYPGLHAAPQTHLPVVSALTFLSACSQLPSSLCTAESLVSRIWT